MHTDGQTVDRDGHSIDIGKQSVDSSEQSMDRAKQTGDSDKQSIHKDGNSVDRSTQSKPRATSSQWQLMETNRKCVNFHKALFFLHNLFGGITTCKSTNFCSLSHRSSLPNSLQQNSMWRDYFKKA